MIQSGRASFSPRPGAEVGSGPDGAAGSVVAGGAWSSAGGPVVNQARQQKEKAQKTRCQWRRIAWSERTMKSAQPNSCLSCLYPCSTQFLSPYSRTISARSAGANGV
jgi:hypothetical protein